MGRLEHTMVPQFDFVGSAGLGEASPEESHIAFFLCGNALSYH
jgi:hypothetical protein